MTAVLPKINRLAEKRARKEKNLRTVRWITAVLLPLALIGIWEWYGNRQDVFAIAPFSRVVASFVEGFASGQYLVALGGTLVTVALGYVIAATLGIAIGLWIGISPFARHVVEPLTNALYATPVSLLIPVIAIYTGLNWPGRVVLIVLWSIFEIIVTTSAGVRSVHNTLVEVGQVFGATRQFIHFKLILPAAMPHLVVGLRLAVARSMRGAVTAELMLAAANLGLIVLTASNSFKISEMLAGIILTMILGVILMTLAQAVERRVLSYLKTDS